MPIHMDGTRFWSVDPQLHLIDDSVPKGRGVILGGTVKSADIHRRVYDRLIMQPTLLNSIMLWDIVAAPRVVLDNPFTGPMEIGVILDDFQMELYNRGLIHPISYEYQGPIESAAIDQRISSYGPNDFDIFSSSRMLAAEYLAKRDNQRWTLGGESEDLLTTVKDDNSAVLSLAVEIPLIESVNNVDKFEKFIVDRKDQRREVFNTIRRLVVSTRSGEGDISKLSAELKQGISELERVVAESKGTYRMGAVEVSVFPLKSFPKRFIENYAKIEGAESVIDNFIDLSLDHQLKSFVSAIKSIGNVKINRDIMAVNKKYKPYLSIIKFKQSSSKL